jgi:hypothetical protein
MGRLFTGESGVGGMAGLRRPGVGDPTATSHKNSCWLLVAGCW